MNERTIRGAAAAFAVATMTLAAAAHAAGTPEQKCEGGKNDAAGKYAACVAKAEKGFVTSGDGAKYGVALGKCETKMISTWGKLEQKAVDAMTTCPSTGDQSDIEDFLDACTQSVAVAVGGGSLPLDVVTCNGDLATCSGDLATCSGDLSTTNADLIICDGDLTTCETDLGTVETDLTTCEGTLTTCDGNLTVCDTDLTTCEGDLVVALECGDGGIDAGEDCDIGNLDGGTCTGEGFAGGVLRCDAGCAYDTSECYSTRFVDNGNGTVTDNQTKLVWEQKTTGVGSGTDFANAHDVDNYYAWSLSEAYLPNGAVFTDFLYRLNGGTSPDGVSTNGCFAGHCDWRLPTIEELQGILLSAYPCGTSPCIDPAFGPTQSGLYWSATTSPFPRFEQFAWGVDFYDGFVLFSNKTYFTSLSYARAVRGGL